MSSCDSCNDEVKARNRELENLLTIAKKQAVEDSKPKAICQDEITGYFITDACTAIQQRFNIKSVVSGLF